MKLILPAVLTAFIALGGSAVANTFKPAPAAPSARASQTLAAGGIAGYQIVTPEFTKVFAHSQSSAVAMCPPGKKALGGGAFGNAGTPVEEINTTMPLSDGSGWNVAMDNTGGFAVSFQVYAVCALAG